MQHVAQFCSYPERMNAFKIKTMKKLAMISFFLLAGAVGFAQEADVEIGKEPSQWSIGPTAGYGHTYITPYTDHFYSHWNLGMTAVYGPVEWWGFGADLLYSIEGGRHSEGHREDKDHITRLSYLRIPVKGMVFLRDYEDDFRPKFTLGPSFGFLLNADDNYDIGVYKFDMGLAGSLGFNYRLYPGTWLTFDIGMYQGITDVRIGNERQDYNGHIGLNLGVAFGI